MPNSDRATPHSRTLLCFFFCNDTAPTEIYTVSDTLSLHDALPISALALTALTATAATVLGVAGGTPRSEEHTSALQSPDTTSYAVFCLKKKNIWPIGSSQKFHYNSQDGQHLPKCD